MDAGDSFQELILILKRIDHAYSKIIVRLILLVGFTFILTVPPSSLNLP